MKASHRKDVIIARLIFAAICLFLIALIATIVITVTSKGGKKKEQDKVQQNAVSESETDSAGDSDTEIGAIYLPQQTTEGTEKTYVTTTSSVNITAAELFADPDNGDLTIKDSSSPIVTNRAGDTRWLP